MDKQFEFINRTYGLSLEKHSPVIENRTGNRGQVKRVDGTYIYIQWDSTPKERGPYHVMDGLSYPAQ
jgi:hypothetical protein